MDKVEQPAIDISHLTKRYDRLHGIFDISLQVEQGEVFGFLGPNGAGKSTTINTLLDILRLDEGVITILGHDHRHDIKHVHSLIGYLAADTELDLSLTGKQYLSFVASQYGNVSKENIEKLINRLKADVAVKIKHLSRGNRQKIGLIAALMHNPEILILDEPTSGLDPLIQAEFNEIIREHKAAGKTTFISSHVLSEVQTICDRVGFIRRGKLFHVDTLESLLKRASRHVSVTFQGSAPIDALTSLHGLNITQKTSTSIKGSFDGDMNELIALLSKQTIKNLEITEADLESLFMSYYAEGDNHA